MMSFVKSSIFLLAISPFSLGCPAKLMDGKDKEQNRREVVELLRKLADMLEEQDNRLPWDQPTVDTPDDIANPRWQNPNGYPTGPPRIQNGHATYFGIDIDNAVDSVTPVSDCPLWDDGTCGLKAAAGEENQFSMVRTTLMSTRTPVLLHNITVPLSKTGRSILLAITPLTITLGSKVRGVLKNSGNSQGDGH